MRWAMVMMASLAGATMSAEASFELVPRDNVTRVIGKAGWSDSVEKGDFSGKPHIEVKEDGSTLAEGWLLSSPTHVLLKLIVADTTPSTTPANHTCWNGDSVQIGIDGRGDAPELKSNALGPDDYSVTLADTEKGPLVWGHFQGRSERGYHSRDGELPWPLTISHDSGKTIYHLHIPWKDLGTQPGIDPTFGLAVQINLNQEGGKTKQIKWADGAGGRPKPLSFNRLHMPMPASVLPTVRWNKMIRWDSYDTLTAAVTAPAGSKSISIHHNEKTVSPDVKGDGGKHFQLRMTPLGKIERLAVQLGEDIQTVPVLNGVDTFKAVVDELRAKALTVEPALFKSHLTAVADIISVAWPNMGTTGDIALETETIELLKSIQAGMKQPDFYQWQTYLDGKRPLYQTVMSRTDKQMSFYFMTLPKGYDPSKTYPLFYELHGAGNTHPLSYVAPFLGPEPRERGYAHMARDGFVILPYARGNTRYQGIGESDVWDVYNDVHRKFKIDEDRRYLFGYSMGGGGTWQIATRTPDKWAAIGIFAGGTWGTKTGYGLGENLASIPTFIVCGDKDRIYPMAKDIYAEVKPFNKDAEFHTIEGVGHSYVGEWQVKLHNFIKAKTRKRPDKGAFVIDTGHNRVWGIRANVAFAGSPVGRVAWELKQDGLHLSKTNVASGSVDLSQWGERESWQVFVDGESVYSGPTKTINF